MRRRVNGSRQRQGEHVVIKVQKNRDDSSLASRIKRLIPQLKDLGLFTKCLIKMEMCLVTGGNHLADTAKRLSQGIKILTSLLKILRSLVKRFVPGSKHFSKRPKRFVFVAKNTCHWMNRSMKK